MAVAPDHRSEDALLSPTRFAAVGAVCWRIIGVAGAVWIAWQLFQLLRVVVIPVVFAGFLAAILRPAMLWLRRRGASPGLATAVVVLGAVLLLVGSVALTGYLVYAQADDLGNALADGWDQVLGWVSDSALPVSRADVKDAVDRAGRSIASGGSGGVFRTALSVVEVATQILLTLFLTFFFVKDGRRLVESAANVMRADRAERAVGLAERLWDTVGRYLRGVTMIALVNALSKGVALWLIGVPLIPPIMFVTFVGSYVPFAGPVIAAVAGALVALANGSVVDAGLVILAGLFIQQVEGHVLQPLILGRVMHLHPVVIILSVTAGGVLAGLFGAIVAVPLVSGASVAYGYLTGDDGSVAVEP